MGPVERCLCDGGIDKRSVRDVVHVRGFSRGPVPQNMIQEFFFTVRTDPSIETKRSLFFVAGRQDTKREKKKPVSASFWLPDSRGEEVSKQKWDVAASAEATT